MMNVKTAKARLIILGFYLNVRLFGELMDGDIGLGTHVYAGAALTVQVVKALETSLKTWRIIKPVLLLATTQI